MAHLSTEFSHHFLPWCQDTTWGGRVSGRTVGGTGSAACGACGACCARAAAAWSRAKASAYSSGKLPDFSLNLWLKLINQDSPAVVLSLVYIDINRGFEPKKKYVICSLDLSLFIDVHRGF